MKDNEITIEQYNYNHPKGNIGLLSKKVKDIIIPLEKTCTNNLSDDVNSVILNMFKFKEGYTCIIDKEDNMIGIITDHNIRECLVKENCHIEKINKLITKNYKSIDNLEMNILDVYSIKKLYIPVVINNKLIGIIKNNSL
jgi:hypothetical protein